jgi:hypothetical protein
VNALSGILKVETINETEARFAGEPHILGKGRVQDLTSLHRGYRGAIDALHHLLENELEVVSLPIVKDYGISLILAT